MGSIASLQCQDASLIPAWHNGFKDPALLQLCGIGHNCNSDLIPHPGTPCASGQPKKKKKLYFQCPNTEKISMEIIKI